VAERGLICKPSVFEPLEAVFEPFWKVVRSFSVEEVPVPDPVAALTLVTETIALLVPAPEASATRIWVVFVTLEDVPKPVSDAVLTRM
jgi:hypothetical protein